MIYVSIIDDDKVFRDNLAILIEGTKEFSCVGVYGDCETALKYIENDPPDVILMDIEIPGKMSGIQGVRKMKALIDDVDIIMLTVHDEPETIFESLKAGACGYLIKNIDPIELFTAIKEIHDGGAPMSMHIARMVVNSFKEKLPIKPLSDRQRQVLKKLCEGKSYQIIANELFISKTTVKFHIKNIYEILQVTNKVGAVRKAMEERLY
jgi:DNA-binding NarL/FixJ family response regulator